MKRSTVSLRSPKTLLVLLVALAALAYTVGALAGHDATTSYTGCLDKGPNKGNLYRIAPGDAPSAPCKDGDVEVHLGGGDITAVIAGTGLAGGSSAGEATLAIEPSYRLPQQCLDGEVAKSFGSEWVCAADLDTTYSAGIGLQLIGTTFDVHPAYQLPQGCGSGQLTAWNGFEWVCIDPPAQTGVVATLNAGTSLAIGSTDTGLCDDGQNEGGDAGPFTFTAGPVHLDPGVYMAVPAGLHWQITKNAGSSAWDDADVFWGGRVSASVFNTHFDRAFNSRGLIADDNRDFGVFIITNPAGSDVSLTIEAYAWACSRATISGPVAIVRIG